MYRNRTDMKKVIVCGGSRGIGAAIVRKFAENGDKVAFVYRNATESARALSEQSGAYAVRADLSVPEEAERAMKEASDALGGVDVLINCAGISEFSLFTEISDEAWRRMIDTNLSSAFYTSRYAARLMIKAHDGRIVNIGSVWGRCGSSCEVHYSASKSALRGLTMSLAKELGPSNITVNCIEPGLIDTEMNSCLSDETKKELTYETPLCRIGTCEDVAEVVFFICSDGASFITGQCIGVDGGFAL